VFERFTEQARRAVVLAQEEARAFGHHYLGTEHLLLGLLREPDGIVARALARFGVTAELVRRDLLRIVGPGRRLDPAALAAIGIDLDQVRRRVEDAFGPGALDAPLRPGCRPGQLPFAPRAKKVLELALREAVALGHRHIGAEHILLGILREGEGVAARILVERGVSVAAGRGAVLDELAGRAA
jgi:ATP-dependent Clp protease ATP-binding subunit ClpA